MNCISHSSVYISTNELMLTGWNGYECNITEFVLTTENKA